MHAIEGEDLSARNTTTALRKFASLCSKSPKAELQQLRQHPAFVALLTAAQLHLPAMNTFQLSNCMQDVSLLGVDVGQGFISVADQRVQELVMEFNVSSGDARLQHPFVTSMWSFFRIGFEEDVNLAAYWSPVLRF